MPNTHSRPNVLLFICDDLAWGDLACHGNPYIHTPNLDRLHGESSRWEHYCSGPLCSPARASLLTGRYHLRTRVIDTYCGRSIIDPGERTLAHSLSDNGYQCGAFGKWHLGDCYPSRACDLGFHETVMHNAGGIGQPGDHPENNARWQTTSYFDPILYRNGHPQPHRGYCSDIFTNEAIRFIDSQKDSPFFAYVATNAPHSPMIVAEEWSQKYVEMGVDPHHAKVYGMVENIDYNVGRLLEHLVEKELTNDTIFIFTSDHGPCGSADSPTTGEIRWNAGLRDRKGTLYQGGIKVPFLIRYPAAALKKETVSRVASPMDVMPTLLDFCSVTSPKDVPAMDGISFRGLMCTDTETIEPPKDRQIFMQWHRGDVPIPYRNAAVIGDRYKYYTHEEKTNGELYDLIADPAETTDLAEAQSTRVAKMRRDYEAWLFDMAGTRGIGTFDSQPIHIGSDAETNTLLTTNDWRLVTGDGWDRSDLRGYWRVKVISEANYSIRIRFKDTPDNGLFCLSIDDTTISTRNINSNGWVDFPIQSLTLGYIRLEAWLESPTENLNLYLQRFLPAFYMEISRL